MAPLQLSLSSFEFYTRTLRPPRLSPSPAVDAELQSLLYLILKDFVGSWYGAISNNDEFYAEVVASIAGVIAGLETRLRKIDLDQLLLVDLPTLLSEHVVAYRECAGMLGTPADGGCTSAGALLHLRLPHPALSTREGKGDHLRAIIDLALRTLMPANEIGADALRFLVREAVAITALANVLDKTSEPDFVADAVLKVIAALEAPVSADADELAEQSKKPKAKRPWHRAVSSHVVNPVTIRQLRVLSQSRPLSPNEEQPAVQTVSPWAISSWMDSFAGLAGNALALGQSTMQSVLNASRTVLLGVQPEALDSNSETGETRPSSSPPESKPRLPAMHRPWLEFLVDSLALRDRDSPGSFLYNLITYLLEPALLWILGQNRLNALLTNVIAQSAAEKKIAVYLKQLRNALWPDGTFNRNPTVRTEEEKAELQLRAKEAIFARIPYAVRFALTDSYVAKHFDATWAAFQDKKAVEHLFLRITDAIVVKLFAEELDELAKLPSAAVPSARPALEPIVEPRPTTLQWDILSSMESDIRETRSFTPSPGIIPRTQSSPAQSPSRSRTTVLGRR